MSRQSRSAFTGFFKPPFLPQGALWVRLLYGVEANILDGRSLDLPDSCLEKPDYVIASMHHPPRTKAADATADYLKALENLFVTVLGHCDNTQFPVDYDAVTESCRRNHVLVEVNEVSLGNSGYHQAPGTDIRKNYEELVHLCMDKQIPLLLSSDSHGITGIGRTPNALSMVQRLGFPEELIVNFHPDLLHWRS